MGAQLYDDAIWARAATELGLSLFDAEGEIIPAGRSTTSHYMRGTVGDQLVTATHLSPNAFSVHVTFAVSLLLGLSVHRHPIGLMRVNSIESGRGQALISRVGTLERAIHLVGSDTRLTLTDSTVETVRVGLADGVGFYTEAIRRAVDIANRALEARRLLEKTPWERVMIQSWSRLAEAENLQFDVDRMRIRGIKGHHAFGIWLVPADRKFEVRARVELPTPLGIGLSVCRGDLIDRVLPFMQRDIRTGDHEFDRMFVIAGEPSEAVCERLSPSVRELMLQLARRGKISLADDAIDFDTDDLGVDVGRLFADLGALARDLEHRASPSPYR